MTERPVHSPLGASSAERWMKCPGSVALIAMLQMPPSDEPDFTKDGHAAHETAAALLTNGSDAWELAGTTASNGVEITASIANAVQEYLDFCRARKRVLGGHGELEEVTELIEVGLQMEERDNGYGTGDYVLYAHLLAHLEVTDYKNGAGILVEVDNNPQLMYYAYMAIQRFPDARTVRLNIVQPNAPFHPDGIVRSWETTAEHIVEWVQTSLLPAMDAVQIDATLDPGEHCRFCPAKLVCPVLSDLFKAAACADPARVVRLDGETIARDLAQVAAVKFYVKALEKAAYAFLNSGTPVPGFKLVYQKADRRWAPGAPDLVVRFGDDAYEDRKIKSVAGIEKLSGDAKAFVKEWSFSPKTTLTVAPADDKRPAVAVKSGAETFAHIMET